MSQEEIVQYLSEHPEWQTAATIARNVQPLSLRSVHNNLRCLLEQHAVEARLTITELPQGGTTNVTEYRLSEDYYGTEHRSTRRESTERVCNH